MSKNSQQAYFDAYLGAWNAHDSAAVRALHGAECHL